MAEKDQTETKKDTRSNTRIFVQSVALSAKTSSLVEKTPEEYVIQYGAAIPRSGC